MIEGAAGQRGSAQEERAKVGFLVEILVELLLELSLEVLLSLGLDAVAQALGFQRTRNRLLEAISNR
jgi:hypothetical protein